MFKQTKDVNMKKLLVAVVAMTMTASAFAAGENMVRVFGWDAGDRARSVDLSLSGNDAEDAENASQNIALNYARAFGQWQVGITYKSFTSTVDGDSSATINADEGSISYDNGNTIGLSGYYNLKEDLQNTCYFALHYQTTTLTADSVSLTSGGSSTSSTEDTDAAQTDIILEYGHRWAIGTGWGFHLTYAPNVMYTMTTTSFDNDDLDDVASTDLAWNFLKFDVMF